MATARDLIKGSLRLIGALATGETPSSDELADGLSALNDMIESWSLENLVIYAKTRETFTLVAGTGSYTMGSGGTFNTTRPLKIENAGLYDSANSSEIPIKIITKDEWASINLKSTQGDPIYLYPEGTNPLETLNLYPVPSDAKTLVTYSWKPLTTFASATTTITLPPGYARALRYGLAVELAPEFGKAASVEVIGTANSAKASIKRMNIRPVFLTHDESLMARTGTYDIYSGEYL